jgi:hypothetical protein
VTGDKNELKMLNNFNKFFSVISNLRIRWYDRKVVLFSKHN